MSFTSADGLPPRFGYGAMEGIPYNTTFDPVTIQFAMDGAGLTYKYFYEWTNRIVNYRAKGQRMNSQSSGKVPYEVAYKDDFCAENIEIIVYEPALNESTFFGSRVINDMQQFKHEAEVIVANRLTDDLNDVADKIYSRDLFGND
jgi:hypothetical protein